MADSRHLRIVPNHDGLDCAVPTPEQTPPAFHQVYDIAATFAARAAMNRALSQTLYGPLPFETLHFAMAVNDRGESRVDIRYRNPLRRVGAWAKVGLIYGYSHGEIREPAHQAPAYRDIRRLEEPEADALFSRMANTFEDRRPPVVRRMKAVGLLAKKAVTGILFLRYSGDAPAE